MFHAMLVRGDLANSGELSSCAPNSGSPEDLVGFLCKRKRDNCHKDSGAEGLFWAPVGRGLFSSWMVLKCLFSMYSTMQRYTLVNRDLRSVL